MKFSWKKSTGGGRTPPKVKAAHKGKKVPPVAALILSFVGGVGAGTAFLAVSAMLLTKALLPLSLVEPLACAACGLGAGISGLVLAALLGHQRLLCGLGCGAFYALCLVLATVLQGGTIQWNGGSLSIAAILLFGGMFGGALTALRAQSRAPER